MVMKKPTVIHPFLFAIFPILFLFSRNIEQASFSETLLPSAIVLVFTVLLVLLLKWILKDSNKAGIIVSIFLVLFFSYGRIYDFNLTWHIGHFYIGRHRYLMLTFVMIFTCAAYFIVKIRRDLYNFTSILNVMALSLVVISLVNIGIYKLNTRGTWQDNHISTEHRESDIMDLGNAVTLRDIYYIILDGYASSSTLKEIYDYDNREFTDYLTEKGFYIASESRSNYAMTSLSLASSLNMEYINYLSDTLGIESKDQRVISQMIRHSKVMNFLELRGYRFIRFSSMYAPTNLNRVHVGISEFQMVLIQTTMLKPFETSFIVGLLRENVLFTFSKLAEVYKTEGPKFVFAHIIVPHPPFIFDANGERVPINILKMGGWVWTQKEKYLNQLIFVNKKVETLVDEILSKSGVSPIIILQADHGPTATLSDGVYDGWQRPTGKMLRERMRIFNAYYLPPDGSDLLYDNITPVNTFRLVFNLYFDKNYELLNDQSYFSNYDHPYGFVDVTDKVKYD
jgi:hypothetical protein